MAFFREKPWQAMIARETQLQVEQLFLRTEVLVEVDCPGAASDYYLFSDKEELDTLVRTLPANTKLFLTGVVDLRNRAHAIRVLT